jgi:hippurate hydrolase
VQDRIEAALRDAAAGIALAHGVEADVTITATTPRR